nr:unnamed protein product [Digitaria exilis]
MGFVEAWVREKPIRTFLTRLAQRRAAGAAAFLASTTATAAIDGEGCGEGDIPQLSSIANSVVSRCSRILAISTENLQQSFETDFPHNCNNEPNTYARELLEYCCHKALHGVTTRPDYLADKNLRRLMFDMMLAWETPGSEDASVENGIVRNSLEIEDVDEGSIFYTNSTRLAVQVDDKKTVGLSAFARIAPSCPIIADLVTVHNLFDALTSSSGGRLHFLVYDKYLKSLDRGLVSYALPFVFLIFSVVMLWRKYSGDGKLLEVLEVKPPPSKNAVEQILILQEGISKLEDSLQAANIALLKFRSVLFASVPKATEVVAAVLIFAAAILVFVPSRHLFLMLALELYTREMPLRKQNTEKFRRRIREWWARIPAAPVQLIRPDETKKKR